MKDDDAEVNVLEVDIKDLTLTEKNPRQISKKDFDAVGRMACNDWIRNRSDYKIAVVLDDDCGGVVSDFTTTPTLNNNGGIIWKLMN